MDICRESGKHRKKKGKYLTPRTQKMYKKKYEINLETEIALPP
jgi:hypothetical protein